MCPIRLSNIYFVRQRVCETLSDKSFYIFFCLLAKGFVCDECPISLSMICVWISKKKLNRNITRKYT